MHDSLSSFLRTTAGNSHDGPVPAETRDRIRVVETAERAFERSLSPAERAERSLVLAFFDLRQDTARLQAARELAAENAVSLRCPAFVRGVKVDKAPLAAMQDRFDAAVRDRRAACIETLGHLIAQAGALRAALEAETPPSEPAHGAAGAAA